MHFVDHQHLHADRFHVSRCRLLHLGDVGAWSLWRAEKCEEFGVEAPLAGPAGPQIVRQPLPLKLAAPG